MKLSRNKHILLICLGLVIVTMAVYLQVTGYEFTNYDDPDYVSANDIVKDGLTGKGFVWAFSAIQTLNWHPLTWLSLMFDCELFGANAGALHAMNLVFHIINTLLLFWVLIRMTGLIWQSGFVAALFALHPLHVESVAWISERKDVLSTVFWLLTMLAYVRYVEKKSAVRYGLVVAFFVLGLLSKPMLVTLPFVLLLMDYWPLKRLQADKNGSFIKSATNLVVEKIPLFILVVLSCIVTVIAQKSGGAVMSLRALPLGLRILKIPAYYSAYMSKMIWPSRLAVFYPFREVGDISQVIQATVGLIIISAVCVRWRKRFPYLLTGWLWFLGTLIPVIGLMRVGEQSIADRYTYITLTGLFIMITWGASDYVRIKKLDKNFLFAAAVVILSALAVVTYKQVGYWKNSITLHEHSLAVTDKNHIAHFCLGMALEKEQGGDIEKAIEHYKKAIECFPFFYNDAVKRLVTVLVNNGRFDEAIAYYHADMPFKKGDFSTPLKLGQAFEAKGDVNKAIEQYKKALEQKSDCYEAQMAIGFLLGREGKLSEAIEIFQQAVQSNPNNAQGYYNLGYAFELQGELEKAAENYKKSYEINPEGNPAGHRLEILSEKLKAADSNR